MDTWKRLQYSQIEWTDAGWITDVSNVKLCDDALFLVRTTMSGAEAGNRFPLDVDKTGAIRTHRIPEGAIPVVKADGIYWMVRIGGCLLSGAWREAVGWNVAEGGRRNREIVIGEESLLRLRWPWRLPSPSPTDYTLKEATSNGDTEPKKSYTM